MADTHGLMEVEIAKALKIPYDEYINADSQGAIVEMKFFQYFIQAIRAIHTQNNDPIEITPTYIRSNIHGVGFLLTKYTLSDDFMDDFTDGQIKEGNPYLVIRQLGDSGTRFNHSDFLDKIKTEYTKFYRGNDTPMNGAIVLPPDGLLTPADPAGAPIIINEPQMATPVEEEVIAINVKEKTLIDEIIKYFDSTYGSGYYKVRKESEKHKKALISYETTSITVAHAEQLADALEKNILILHVSDYLNTIKKKFNKKLMMKYFIVIVPKVKNISDKFRDVGHSSEFLCLGKRVKEIYAPIVTVDENDKGISPFSKYDCIFKDNVTNILFALRDSFILYIMIGTKERNESGNGELFNIIIKEIIRRWNGELPYDELVKIDQEYERSISENNKNEYIKFCTENANAYINSIKKALADAIKEIGDLQKKLAESLKMYRQYNDIIENFNEDKHHEKEAARALKTFDEVLLLPQVKSLFIQDNKVHVYTNDINVKDTRKDGKLHNLGTFHIQLGLHHSDYDPKNSVIIKNTKHRITGFSGDTMEAPHIFNNGIMCHGNLVNSITQHYKDRDLYNVIMDLIIFLESVNTEDAAGKHIHKWPVVEEVEKKKEDPKEKKDKIEEEFDNQFTESLATPI